MNQSDDIIALAHQLRLGHSLQAVQTLPDLLDRVARQSSTWGTERQAYLPILIRQMLAQQEREDWLGLADNLEYDLLTLLEP